MPATGFEVKGSEFRVGILRRFWIQGFELGIYGLEFVV